VTINTESPLAAFLNSEPVRALKASEAMSESEWIEHAVALANEPLVTQGLIKRLLLSGGGETVDGEVVGALSEAFRDEFRKSLVSIATDLEAARRDLAPQVAQIRREVVCLPFAVENGQRVRYRIISLDVAAAVRYAVVLLLDKDSRLGPRLAYCRLESCGRFFFVEDTGAGRRRRRYCCDKHMNQADEARSAERVSASRANMSVQAWRKRMERS
jgi:hypothetical protein